MVAFLPFANRLLRVHLVPLKFNLEPEAWLQPDMHVFVNDAFIETMPKVPVAECCCTSGALSVPF